MNSYIIIKTIDLIDNTQTNCIIFLDSISHIIYDSNLKISRIELKNNSKLITKLSIKKLDKLIKESKNR